jgi:prolyl-tRNA synthetase
LGLKFRAVAADNGAIGGTGSQEFHVIADTGEDAIAYCPNSEYAANIETAEALSLIPTRLAASQDMSEVATPSMTKCEEVAKLLGIGLEKTVKSIVLAVDGGEQAKIYLLLIRGDHELNEVKASKVAGLSEFRFATEAEILQNFVTPPGYIGPVGIKASVTVVADRTVANINDFVCGANREGFHLTGVNWGRDLPEPIVADIRNVVSGDASPDGQGVLEICRGIEVGHVFQLGTRYSESMNCTYLDEKGQQQPMVMGCYGIGVTRVLGAAIEQRFDERGILWPVAIAPFQVVICPMGYDRSENVKLTTDRIYQELLEQGVEVIVDDRGERPGAMFADWELIGVPYRIVIGERGLKEGQLEFQARSAAEAQAVPVDQLVAMVSSQIKADLQV